MTLTQSHATGPTDPPLRDITLGQLLPEGKSTDPVMIQYTSGTIGFPKCALLHHRGLVNNGAHMAHRMGVRDGAVWVTTYMREHLAHHKTPRHWFQLDAFPLTGSGKIQKFKLRDGCSRSEFKEI